MKICTTRLGSCLLTILLKAFSVVILFLVSHNGFCQQTISGRITNPKGEVLNAVQIVNKTTKTETFSNTAGEFTTPIGSLATIELLFYKEGYAIVEKTFDTKAEKLIIVLEDIIHLSEVQINKEREKVFALNKLKDVEGTAIYAGKKTEVISISKLTANKATNNARQVFAQVVGLTIIESNDGGLQLSIGGRGLNPNRTSNFNTRQNDYDISADVLGYPESYYATPVEALDKIQIIRGAASLQYGTQFGGLVNFVIKSPSDKKIEFTIRNTMGSFGLYTNFSSLSGTLNKWSYYSFVNFKKGSGFRPNSQFESKNYFGNINYHFTSKTSLHFDYTHFNYLAQQAGGLTDVMFAQDPTQSNRTRNWFAVNWNLFGLRFNHSWNQSTNFSLQLFGLDASRKAVGYRSNRVSNPDTIGTERDLIIGKFVNWGFEARFLKNYQLLAKTSTFLLGAKYYQSKNSGIQGPGSNGNDANFNLATNNYPLYPNQSDFSFPNLNFAFFGENIFKFNSKITLTPGFRFENIKTQAIGFYRKINLDLAGNVLLNNTNKEEVTKNRNLLLLGLGFSYKPKNKMEVYANVSQNYRSVTFNDIRTVTPSQVIAENITDEKGYTSDIGCRGQIKNILSFDASIFGLYYKDKIGEYFSENPDGSKRIVTLRNNLGTGFTYGLETLLDWSLNHTFFKDKENLVWHIFSNLAITDSQYLQSDITNIKGNKVEFVPLYNIKSGTSVGFKNFLSSLQFTAVSAQFTNGNNSITNLNDNTYGIFGEIPSYYVLDLSTSYKWKNWKLEAGVNNLTNNSYFTRRASGYPGPGIIPSESRSFYTTLEFKF